MQIVYDVAQLVEPGSPTQDDQGSIPGVAIDFFSTISGRDGVPPEKGSPSEPSQPTTVDQTNNELDGERILLSWPPFRLRLI